MERFHLRIRKCYDRKKLAKFFRDMYSVSLLKAFQMVDSMPFEDERFFGEEVQFKGLEDVAEFSFIKNEMEEFPYSICPMIFPPLSPEEEEYMEAIKWYNDLPDEDRRRVDILAGRVKANEV